LWQFVPPQLALRHPLSPALAATDFTPTHTPTPSSDAAEAVSAAPLLRDSDALSLSSRLHALLWQVEKDVPRSVCHHPLLRTEKGQNALRR
jgi:hypothetical protein